MTVAASRKMKIYSGGIKYVSTSYICVIKHLNRQTFVGFVLRFL